MCVHMLTKDQPRPCRCGRSREEHVPPLVRHDYDPMRLQLEPMTWHTGGWRNVLEATAGPEPPRPGSTW